MPDPLFPVEMIEGAIAQRMGELQVENVQLDLTRQIYAARIRELEQQLAELRAAVQAPAE